MRIALIGHGAMGKFAGSVAETRGHNVGTVIDSASDQLSAKELAGQLKGSEAAIDFSLPAAVLRNAEACGIAGVPLVEGTTGWHDQIEEAQETIDRLNGSFVYGANFSIGVNLFYRIVEDAAELLSRIADYEVFIEEQHHSKKVDAPSGTALKLRRLLEKHVESDIGIASTRAGKIPGTHRVGFDGSFDQILLQHTARSKGGFALGAVLAAEWAIGKKGFWEFGEIIDEILEMR